MNLKGKYKSREMESGNGNNQRKIPGEGHHAMYTGCLYSYQNALKSTARPFLLCFRKTIKTL